MVEKQQKTSTDRQALAQHAQHDRPTGVRLGDHTPSVSKGLAVWDLPNLSCAVYDLLGRRPRGSERIDARALRSDQRHRCGIHRFLACYRHDPWTNKSTLRDYLRRSHWKTHAVASSRFGFDPDPVDDWIHEMIYRQMELPESHLLSVISHDGGFADPIARFLTLHQSRVWIVGFPERLSHKLTRLARLSHRVQLVDIQHDAQAVVLPQRMHRVSRDVSATTHHPDQTRERSDALRGNGRRTVDAGAVRLAL